MTRRATFIATAAVAISLAGALTFLDSAREKARQQNDLSQVKALLCALQLYAHDYGEALPADLAVLFEQDYCSSGKVYVSPGSATRPPLSAAEMRAGQCDYLYYGRGLTLRDCTRETVILMTRPPNKRHWVNLGFADGQVEGRDRPPPLYPHP
jgi:hypothetical protein